MTNLPPPRPAEDIRQLARDFNLNRVYISDMIPEHVLGMVFIPLMLGALEDWTEEEVRQVVIVGVVGTHFTADRSINGFPIFFECAVWLRSDLRKAAELADAAQKAQEAVLGGQ